MTDHIIHAGQEALTVERLRNYLNDLVADGQGNKQLTVWCHEEINLVISAFFETNDKTVTFYVE